MNIVRISIVMSLLDMLLQDIRDASLRSLIEKGPSY